MKFLLIHGAWHGGWAWDQVARELLRAGHEVIVPDLPGLGGDAHNLSKGIDLEQHIQFVMPDEPCIVCGHSYGGLLVRAIVDRKPDVVIAAVLIEALWPENGQCALDLVPDIVRHDMQRKIDALGDGWRLPPPDPGVFKINNAALESQIAVKLSDQPARTFTDALYLMRQEETLPPGSFILASDRQPQPYRKFANKLADQGWSIIETTGGHELPLTQPALVARTLQNSAYIAERTHNAT